MYIRMQLYSFRFARPMIAYFSQSQFKLFSIYWVCIFACITEIHTYVLSNAMNTVLPFLVNSRWDDGASHHPGINEY